MRITIVRWAILSVVLAMPTGLISFFVIENLVCGQYSDAVDAYFYIGVLMYFLECGGRALMLALCLALIPFVEFTRDYRKIVVAAISLALGYGLLMCVLLTASWIWHYGGSVSFRLSHYAPQALHHGTVFAAIAIALYLVTSSLRARRST